MDILFNLLYEIIIFQNILLPHVVVIRYVDELCVAILFILAAIKWIRNHKKWNLLKVENKAIIAFIIFVIIGGLGSILYQVQPTPIPGLKDVLAISKFIVLYISTVILTQDIDKEKLLERVAKRTVIYIHILFITAIINIFFDIGVGSGVRYGLRSYKFLFTHPTYLVSSMVLMLSVLTAASSINYFDRGYKFINNIADRRSRFKFVENLKRIKKVDIYILEGLCVLALTFRSKAFLYIAAYIMIRFAMRFLKRIKLIHIIPMILVGVAIAYDKVVMYFSWGLTAARPALHIVGVDLAMKYFPIGSGFGTFASSLSGEYYSPIYYDYSLSTVWGMTPKEYNYIADVFWPYIYGQFGVLGLLLFVIILYYLVEAILNRYRKDNRSLAALLIVVYILIASTAEAIFTDITGSFSFIVLATYLGSNHVNLNNDYFKLTSLLSVNKKSNLDKNG